MSFLSEEDKEKAIRELPANIFLPWGAPFPAEELVAGANVAAEIVSDHKYSFIPLWSEQPETEIPFQSNQRESVCLLTTNTLTERKKPAVLIVPGGGYEIKSMNQEGIQIAEAFEAHGYCAFVLHYRVAPNRFPEPQKDLALAIRYLRVHAEDFRIDPENLLLVGFSAGGHLIASYTAWEESICEALFEDLDRLRVKDRDKLRQVSGKPNKLCLGYPVISFRRDIAHEPSFQALTGGDEELREKLSVENHVTADWPKTYLWTCRTDELVDAENTRVMDQALTGEQIDHRCHIFETGLHGVGLGIGMECGVWLDEAIAFFR